MGYDTTMYVVATYSRLRDDEPDTGSVLAMVELCGCGNGPVGRLISQHTRQKDDKVAPFGLYPSNPDRQQEAADYLRELSKNESSNTSEYLQELSDDIEDGLITTDKYGDYLGVIDIDDMIAALAQEADKYRRFKWAWLLLTAIKDIYKEGTLKVITYGH